MLIDAQIVILLAGVAGNTGGSVTPIVARLAREMGAATVVAVTTPHDQEGEIRVRRSAQAVQTLKREADSVECFSAQALLNELPESISQGECFEMQNQRMIAYVRDLTRRNL